MPGPRTGNGRVKLSSQTSDTSSADGSTKAGRTVGAGAQALAWGSTSFSKSRSPANTSVTSVSTSPDTDPSAELFPFFKEGATSWLSQAN